MEDPTLSLQLYNTLTKRKEEFRPIEPGLVKMYNCGPTVYSFAHIGNFASFLTADVLRRYLEYSGFEVRQVMNITDVGHLTDDADSGGEDKLEKAARERKVDPWQIAREFEAAFHEDRRRLNLLDALEYPRATDHIPEMLEMIEELLGLGLAYEAGEQVYFEIGKYPPYGRLSGNTIDELMAGARVEEDPAKRSPLDFTLWKKDPRHIMKWDSPWGVGFPGWHIECSAMSRKYLGPEIDIHTGGEDNIFPHHECEIAQSSRGEDRPFARYWVHRRHILVEGKKMSKSAGNFYTVRDLIDRGYDGLEIRYSLISSHYRSNSNFTFQGLEDARKNLRYLREFLLNMGSLPDRESAGGDLDSIRSLAESSDQIFRSRMDDDLNVSAALAQVHDFCGEAYKICKSRGAGERAAEQLEAWDRTLGVLALTSPTGRTKAATLGGTRDDEVVAGLTSARIDTLLAEREAARRRKDWGEADRIRDALLEKGIAIKDGPAGTRWHRRQE